MFEQVGDTQARAEIVMIYCANANNVIGKGNDLINRFKADMQRFRELTMGHVVVMGRKTWESLPLKYRPLPGRDNIVVSRNKNYEAPGARVISDPLSVMYLKGPKKVFIIGGGELYRLFELYADKAEITQSNDVKPGDVYAPILSRASWKVALPTTSKVLDENMSNLFFEDGIHYHFKTMVRT